MATPPTTTRPRADAGRDAGAAAAGRRAWWGLAAGVLVVAAAMLVPPVFDVVVKAGRAAPLIGDWDLRVGPMSIVALALVALAARPGVLARLERLTWGQLLALSWLVSVVWMVSLALVDGPTGLGKHLEHGTEYLGSARAADDVGEMLRVYISRIPLDSAHHWPVHLAGHPPGAVLMFVGLDRLGLGSWQAAGAVVVLVAGTVPAAVAVTLDRLAARDAARRALPFLVLAPTAVLMAVSADALFTATVAWGMAALAAAGAATAWRRPALAVLAGLLLGWCLLESYGLGLVALLAVAVLVATGGAWRPRLVVGALAAGTALLVVLLAAGLGFAWWDAYPVLHDRYWDPRDLASKRPFWYWSFGNLGSLFLAAGLLLPAALGAASVPVARLRRAAGRARAQGWERVVAPLVVAGVAMVLAADLSRMSKAEVERIWLPFMPWMLLAVLWLPPRWQRWGLVGQGVLALALAHGIKTVW
ncbi:hypothetical protein [Nostocoides sp. Soil756]|jgi:hypothetical protein|uniref:hypothetical protein n=1 Tax=Nostocoides sp. Soil756 TaxID=1736399 RepID=UPI0006FE771F|nr:hypothetical protein [Tetrasphaera sp. Soil756]KRE63412.1 hypothetical protein ASG78_00410 [Tetrasphaera sp. Soil756]